MTYLLDNLDRIGLLVSVVGIHCLMVAKLPVISGGYGCQLNYQ